MSDIIFKKSLLPCLYSLGEGEIHLWRLNRGGPDAELLLSQEECSRKAKYLSKDLADSFLKGRAGIRYVAARYTGHEPSSFLVSQEENGKPFFLNAAEFHFNLSDSEDLVIAAVSTSRVGVDIERRGRRRNFFEIAQRFFDADEADLVAKAGDQIENVFLNLWTAKEAMLKLSGRGLGHGIHNAKVRAPGEGLLSGTKVFLEHFIYGEYIGAVASFSRFKVKGWFDL